MQHDATAAAEPGIAARSLAFVSPLLGAALVHFALRRMPRPIAAQRASDLAEQLGAQYVPKLSAEDSAAVMREAFGLECESAGRAAFARRRKRIPATELHGWTEGRQ